MSLDLSGMSTFFCSELSRSRNDQIFGTVKPTRLIVALEYWPAWDRKAILSEFLPEEVRQLVYQLRVMVPETRFLLVRQPGSQFRKPSCFVALPSEGASVLYRFQLDGYRDLVSIDFLALLERTSSSSAVTDPMFLVCNHGKHDRCCAKYGTAVLDSLKASFEDFLWESSHLGGCRFAANLVCLRHGLAYGHLSPETAREAAQKYSQGTIFLPNYRGRCNYPRPVQAAEYFIRRETGVSGVDDLRLVSSVATGGDLWTTTFVHAGTQTAFRAQHSLRKSETSRQLACSEKDPDFIWTHHLLSIESLFKDGRGVLL